MYCLFNKISKEILFFCNGYNNMFGLADIFLRQKYHTTKFFLSLVLKHYYVQYPSKWVLWKKKKSFVNNIVTLATNLTPPIG